MNPVEPPSTIDRIRPVRLLAAVAALASSALLWAACSSGGRPPPAPPEPLPAPVETEIDHEKLDLKESLRLEREQHGVCREERAAVSAQLAEVRGQLVALKERYASLEQEIGFAMDEIVRSKASSRGVENRALAISLISEARVQLESLSADAYQEVALRVERAAGLLDRADAALQERNYAGASYLADRASEVLRQARLVAEIRSSTAGVAGEVIPIVPPRPMRIDVPRANLRDGPGTEHRRLATLEADEEILALARSGDWLQVETSTGLKAWILARLTRR